MSKKSHRRTGAQCTWLCLLCLLVLANVGCQGRQNADIAGVNIPIPANMTKNPDKGFVPIKGFADGQISYEGKVPPSEILLFIRSHGSRRLEAQFVVRRPEKSDHLDRR